MINRASGVVKVVEQGLVNVSPEFEFQECQSKQTKSLSREFYNNKNSQKKQTDKCKDIKIEVVNTTVQNRNIYNACNYKRITAQSKNFKNYK
jgi:hypothetical protein